jgi:hypothetical protein
MVNFVRRISYVSIYPPDDFLAMKPDPVGISTQVRQMVRVTSPF